MKSAEDGYGADGSHLQLALEAAGMGTWEWDVVTDEVRWSTGVAPLFGLGRGEFSGSFERYAALLHPEDRERVRAVVQDALARGPEYSVEHRVTWPDGSLHWLQARGRVYRDAAGKPTLMAGTVFDITARKTAEAELLRVENLFHAIVDDQSEMIVRWKPDGTRTFVNQAYCRAFNATYDELVGKSFLPLVAEPFLIALRARISALTPDSPLSTDRHQSVMPGGKLRWQEWTDRGIFDAKGNLIELQSVGRDVNDAIVAEEALRRANRALLTLRHAAQAVARATTDEELFREMCAAIVEPGAYTMAWVGLARDDEAKTVTVVARAGGSAGFPNRPVTWADGEGGRGPTGTAIRTGKPFVVDDPATDPRAEPWREQAIKLGFHSALGLPLWLDGKVFGSLTIYAPVRGAFGPAELALFEELAEDIAFGMTTLRTRTRHRESEERLRQLAENIREVVWLKDTVDHRMLYVSQAYEYIWGRSCHSLYADPRSFLEGVHPDDHERARGFLEGGEYDQEFRVVSPDEAVRWVHSRAFPIRDAHGRVYRVAGVTEDITEHRRIEEQFRQSQKMEAVGQLAGGIAHDFNNILLAIMLQVRLATETPGLPKELKESLTEIDEGAVRAANLTRQLLQFSRKQVMQPRRVDLNEVVADVARIVQRVLREDVKLRLIKYEAPLFIHADPGMLDQVLMNLAVNARDAMPNGGELRIQTGFAKVSPEEARHTVALNAGNYVFLDVTDTGTGIAPEHLPRIFEPFFTTKEAGKGTGLGLATVFGIVQQHRGTVQLSTAQGKGTTFRILLPSTEQVVESKTVEGAPRALEGGNETILLVEDEASVRKLTRRLLERHGYVVVEAANGNEALRIWEERRGAVQLLLTDVVMPEGPNGRELATRLVAKDPKLKVLLTSGYSSEMAGQELMLAPGQKFLSKPFAPADLLEAVRSSLASD